MSRLLGLALLALPYLLGACAPTKGETGKFSVLHTDNEDFDVSYIDVGIHPIEVTAGDIDGDGLTDLVVSNRFGNNLTILTNGLENSQTLETTVEPTDVVIADLDGANGLDLAVVSSHSNSLNIFLNDGNGGWTLARTYDFIGVITQIEAVDLNGDGSATKDLVFTVGSIENAVVALVNDGTGEFTAVDTPMVTGPGRFVTGLFGQDTRYVDLAVLSPSRDILTILLGRGDGSFSLKAGNSIATRLNPKYIVTLDLDDDGFTDLAVSSNTEQRVSAYRGNSKGIFSLFAEKKVVAGGEALVAGAFNTNPGGAQNDLAIVHRNHRVVSLMFWDSKEHKFKNHRVHVHEDPFAIVKGDFNMDGCTDLAVAENDLRAMSILAGDCAGNFTQSTIGFDSVPSFPVVVDLDGDGGQDIVAVQPNDQKIVVLRNVH